MTRLLVRNLDPDIVSALKRRAAQHGRSAEAEHREILRNALGPQKKSFSEVLASIPNVGEDSDFARVDDTESHNVFT